MRRPTVFRVERFTENPAHDTARQMGPAGATANPGQTSLFCAITNQISWESWIWIPPENRIIICPHQGRVFNPVLTGVLIIV